MNSFSNFSLQNLNFCTERIEQKNVKSIIFFSFLSRLISTKFSNTFKFHYLGTYLNQKNVNKRQKSSKSTFFESFSFIFSMFSCNLMFFQKFNVRYCNYKNNRKVTKMKFYVPYSICKVKNKNLQILSTNKTIRFLFFYLH